MEDNKARIMLILRRLKIEIVRSVQQKTWRISYLNPLSLQQIICKKIQWKRMKNMEHLVKLITVGYVEERELSKNLYSIRANATAA